jgi:pimeloyl-ACP methyl ester carboxylesterase
MQDIFAEDTGNGTPLVLVHGFLGSSDMWNPQIKFFKDDFRVIAPAIPGFGKSSAINSCDSIECMAKAILNLLEKKEIKNFNLLGHSMGGMIVQEIAKIAGEKILKLICYGTGPRGNIPGRFETIDQSREKLKINGLKDTAYRIAKTWFIEEEKAKHFYLCEEAGKQTSIEAADNGLVAMKNWSGIENLKNIKDETLIVWGDQDKAYNFNQVETLSKNIPNSY